LSRKPWGKYYIGKYQQIMKIDQRYYGTPMNVLQTNPKGSSATERSTLEEIKKQDIGFSDMAIG
jgi:hypothetical protein